MRLLSIAAGLLVAAGMLLASPAPSDATQGFDFGTGELSAGRLHTLVCTGINKAEVPSNLYVVLRDPMGNTIGAPTSCPALPIGESCTASFMHDSGIPLVAHCHVSSQQPEVGGNLRLDGPTHVSQTSSDLQAVE